MGDLIALDSATRVTRPTHDGESARRKPYSKPRNSKRDKILSERAARALTWQAGITSFGQRLRLARRLDRWRLQFWQAGERTIAAELQQLRQDVVRNG